MNGRFSKGLSDACPHGGWVMQGSSGMRRTSHEGGNRGGKRDVQMRLQAMGI